MAAASLTLQSDGPEPGAVGEPALQQPSQTAWPIDGGPLATTDRKRSAMAFSTPPVPSPRPPRRPSAPHALEALDGGARNERVRWMRTKRSPNSCSSAVRDSSVKCSLWWVRSVTYFNRPQVDDLLDRPPDMRPRSGHGQVAAAGAQRRASSSIRGSLRLSRCARSGIEQPLRGAPAWQIVQPPAHLERGQRVFVNAVTRMMPAACRAVTRVARDSMPPMSGIMMSSRPHSGCSWSTASGPPSAVTVRPALLELAAHSQLLGQAGTGERLVIDDSERQHVQAALCSTGIVIVSSNRPRRTRVSAAPPDRKSGQAAADVVQSDLIASRCTGSRASGVADPDSSTKPGWRTSRRSGIRRPRVGAVAHRVLDDRLQQQLRHARARMNRRDLPVHLQSLAQRVCSISTYRRHRSSSCSRDTSWRTSPITARNSSARSPACVRRAPDPLDDGPAPRSGYEQECGRMRDCSACSLASDTAGEKARERSSR